MSMNQLKNTKKSIRGTFGKNVIESNAHSKVFEMTQGVNEYFDNQEDEFLLPGGGGIASKRYPVAKDMPIRHDMSLATGYLFDAIPLPTGRKKSSS
jgi:hypothetical protein